MVNTYKVIVLLLLSYSSFTDITTKKVMMLPVWMTYLLALIGLLFPSFGDDIKLLGALPGIALMTISIVSKGAIGAGDAYLAIAVGIFLGPGFAMGILLISSIVAAIYSLIMLVAKRVDRKDKIPFVPFMLCGYMGMLVIGQNFI